MKDSLRVKSEVKRVRPGIEVIGLYPGRLFFENYEEAFNHIITFLLLFGKDSKR
jgi:hypothetical protein